VAPPSLSVVVPVHNEERELPQLLRALESALGELGVEGEILVVDNASTDDTAGAIEPFLQRGVRHLRNEHNRGKGYSIRRGMLEATGDLRLMCDADCTPSLASLPRMLAAAEDADVIVGSRVAEGARVGRQQPLRRRFFGLGFLILTRVLMGRLTRDVYCGFKLWRAEAAETVFDRVELDGWTFDAEALALARVLGLRVREVGIAWVNRPASRLAIGDVLFRGGRELLQARRHVRAEAARRAAGPGERLVQQRAEAGS
jgi:glycosyltransferase involved in cell wall biosynthesis